MPEQQIEGVIEDQDDDELPTQKVSVRLTDSEVFFQADGYGDLGTTPGHGSPVIIELYKGVLRVIVWADINQEDPTHIIELGDARESERREENV